MYIIHVNNAFNQGGSGIACTRMMASLKGLVHQKLLVQDSVEKNTSLLDVMHRESLKDRVSPGLDTMLFRIFPNRWDQRFSLGLFGKTGLPKYLERNKPDILQLHWINGGFLRISDFLDLKIPIIITMHDMWWFTGGCHYDLGCNGFLVQCKDCPAVHGLLSKAKITHRLFQEKIRFLNKDNVHIAVVSHWLKTQLLKSGIDDDKISVIGNTLDFTKFYPSARDNNKREAFSILLGAYNTNDTVKGVKLALRALSTLNIEFKLVVFGTQFLDDYPNGWNVETLGFIKEPELLIESYRNADVFLMPSLQEAFGQTALEALARGTPVVGFENTGLEDLIVHDENGYLAKHMDWIDMAEGIKSIFQKE